MINIGLMLRKLLLFDIKTNPVPATAKSLGSIEFKSSIVSLK